MGSNIGDRQAHIEKALQRLPDVGINVRKVASVIETEPVGGPPQDLYLNTVCQAETELSPRALLTVLKSIEQELGRTESVRNGPREIDLDILLFDQITLNAPDLIIPHPRMRERNFVMQPLSEIAPELVKSINHASD